MNIIPSKNYRKPLYAVGLAAVMMTTAVTGCTDIIRVDGDTTCETTEEIALAGDVAVCDPEGTNPTDPTDEPVELDGDIAECDIE